MLNPYQDLPASQVWQNGVQAVAPENIDPVGAMPFRLAQNDPVASAGVGFAQALAAHLRDAGYNYHQPEPPRSAGEPGYSARHGNIPTTRQLRQLMLGAYGLHRPATRAWRRADGRFIDPLRPQIQPAGFATPAELAEARAAHLLAVRRVLQDCRVFVFTLSATETWLAPDGTALPLHPALVEADMPEGDPRLATLSAAEMRQDLSEFLADLAAVNPQVRVILTTSPVPPPATCQARHILSANASRLAALRVAAEETANSHANVAYFPVDDIVLAALAGHELNAGLSVAGEDGMARVMRLFTRHFMAAQAADEPNDLAATDSVDPGIVSEQVRAADRQPQADDTAWQAAASPVASGAPEAEDEFAEDEPVCTGELPLDIDFSANGNARQYMLEGWSHPEMEYAWTLGKRSVLRLPASGVNCDCTLKFRVGPMVHLGVVDFQRLAVEVNGTLVARLVGRQPGQFEVVVPAAALRRQPYIDIVLHLPDAISPAACGGSGDRRELGFWFWSLRMEPLLAAPMETSVAIRPEPAAVPEIDAAEPWMELQSLGTNCELGFVQRAHGAEPLGLLRWAQTPLPNLLRALQARFEGLGDPEHIAVQLDGAGEFHVIDRKFGIRNHSFAYQNQGATEAAIREREQVRLPFLARLLIEDLELAEKLFCYHDADQSGPDDIFRLLAALDKYGPNWLLWVRTAPSPARVGTAELLRDRLIGGYIDKFNPVTNVTEPSVQAWTSAVRAAYRLWRAAVRKEGVDS